MLRVKKRRWVMMLLLLLQLLMLLLLVKKMTGNLVWMMKGIGIDGDENSSGACCCRCRCCPATDAADDGFHRRRLLMSGDGDAPAAGQPV